MADKTKKGKTALEAPKSSTGFLLLTAALVTVAYNSEAIRILAFPTEPDWIEDVQAFIDNSIRGKLACKRSSETSGFVQEFRSGKRIYVCHALSVSSGSEDPTGKAPTVALLLERQPTTALSLKRKMWERFGLSPREREAVELLMRGMSNKDIAQFMNISSNTVKAFFRTIMMKLNVSTRAGIIGKILDSKTADGSL